ncbi:glycosyltransferase family 4 protein [Thermodesulfobacteriota bacterium]
MMSMVHKRKRISEIKNIGFISTRFAGTDGVSLETGKWVEVLEEMGYYCFYFAGELDTPETQSMLSPMAHFTHPEISRISEYASNVRDALGITTDEIFILQPTRVVQRKGIEHSIELVRRLGTKGIKARLVISHASGDEGDDYEARLREYSDLLGVNTLFVSDIIKDTRGKTKDGRKIYTLFDVYPHADLVTYPSVYEGFGNAFLEAVYFKKPILVNNYSIYLHDIKPKGFRVIEMNDYIKEETVDRVIDVLKNRSEIEKMARKNYKIAKRFYSYANLRRKLRFILTDFFGEE